MSITVLGAIVLAQVPSSIAVISVVGSDIGRNLCELRDIWVVFSRV